MPQFIGDCIMALWNAPQRLRLHEAAAVGAALGMQEQLLDLWTRWERQGLPSLRCVALHFVALRGCKKLNEPA